MENSIENVNLDNITVNVDSDGVLADFMGWCRIYDDTITDKDHEKIFKVMAENYETCFLNCDQLPDTEYYFEHLRNSNSKWRVLTNITPWNLLAPYCKENQEKVMNTLIANKLTWFAERGVEASKIQVNIGDKSGYCRPGDVLIDDYLKNCTAWEQAGGVAVFHQH